MKLFDVYITEISICFHSGWLCRCSATCFGKTNEKFSW